MELSKNLEVIYEHLDDDLSRYIFENKLLHLLLAQGLKKHSKFVDNIILASPAIQQAKNNVNAFFNSYDNVVIYGAGGIGSLFTNSIQTAKNFVVCDSDPLKYNTFFLGQRIISPKELSEMYKDSQVVITVSDYKSQKDIMNNLLILGFAKEQINVWTDIHTAEKDTYFDVFKPRNDGEVFIDAGCCNFGTSIRFAEWCENKYKKIIAFEPNPNQYPECVENSDRFRNSEVHQYGLWNENTELFFDNSKNADSACICESLKESTLKIKTIMLDDILNGDEATFIKMDIEGAELNALKGAKETISKYRPRLAICVYHKTEDIWEIPEYILSLNGDYKLCLRHYSSAATGTVLYAY